MTQLYPIHATAAATAYDWAQVIGTYLAFGAAVAAVWAAIWTHKSSGGRLLLALNPVAFAPANGGSMLIASEDGEPSRIRRMRMQFELAQVVIQNPGRVGLTVTRVELKIIDNHSRSTSGTPRIFEYSDAGHHSSQKDRFFRLQPYDHATVLLDVWVAIEHHFSMYPDASWAHVDGLVYMAGQKDPVHAKGWTVDRHSLTLAGDKQRHIEDLVLAACIRKSTRDLDEASYMDGLVDEVVRQSHPKIDEHRLAEIVINHVCSPATLYPKGIADKALPIARTIVENIRDLEGRVDWGAQEVKK